MASELQSRYPESPYFKCLEVVARFSMKDWNGTVQAGKDFFERAFPSEGLCSSNRSPMVLVLMGDAELARSEFEGALPWLNRCVRKNQESDGGWASWCYLRRGEAYDLLGRRDEALSEYRTVLDRRNVWGAHQKARKFLKAPCRLEEVLEDIHL